jgi:hypothetical protein
MSREKDLRLNIIEAGYRAVEQLIKVAKEDIIKPDTEDDLSVDKLKNAAASKRLAIFDAFEILNKIEAEKATLEEVKDESSKLDSKQGWAERRAK